MAIKIFLQGKQLFKIKEFEKVNCHNYLEEGDSSNAGVRDGVLLAEGPGLERALAEGGLQGVQKGDDDVDELESQTPKLKSDSPTSRFPSAFFNTARVSKICKV